MAHRLKWQIAVAAAFAVILLWAQTTDFGIGRRPAMPQARQELIEVNVALSSAIERYRELAGAAWVKQRLPDTAGLVLELPERLQATDLPVRGALATELADVDTMRARIGVFVLADTTDALQPPGIPRGFVPHVEREIYAGVDENGPYCAVVHTGHSTRSAAASFGTDGRYNSARHINVLGPCYYWARYGAPGPHVAEWLRHGGYRFADQRFTTWRDYDVGNRSGRGLFGMRYNVSLAMAAGAGHACRGGRAESCRAGFLHRDTTVTGAEAAWDRPDPETVTFGWAERALLADLEGARGDARFTEFWRSPEPVERAFEASFGVPLEQWVSNWVSSRYDRVAATPRMAASTILLALTALFVLLALATLAAHRRQIR